MKAINYWGSILTLYLTSGAFSLVCVLSVFFSFFLLIFLFISVFSLTDTNDLKDSRGDKGNHYYLFSTSTRSEHSFSSSRFLPLLFNRSICNYQTDSWWSLFSLEICILFAFSLMQLSRSYWLLHFKLALWGFELIWNYHPSITERTP